MSRHGGRSERDLDGRVLVVGPGRVGVSLVLDLAASATSLEVAVAGRDSDPPPALEALPRVTYLRTGDPPVLPDAPPFRHAGPAAPLRLVFSVPDDALATTASAWAGALSAAGWSPTTALHTSGVHPSGVLAPLRRVGAALGSWHPAVAIPVAGEGRFRGATVGVEGETPALTWARSLAEEVGARSVRVRPGEKARWHAAAVFASNHVVACLAVALREMEKAAEGPVGIEDLLPLARSALEGVAARGLQAGATGPVVRGDAGTVERDLSSLDPRTGSLYRALAHELLRLAEGRLPADRREALEARLRADEGASADGPSRIGSGERERGEGRGRCGST